MEELEAFIRSQSYDTIDISETRWDEFCNRCAVMVSHRLLRRGREGRELVEYLRERLDSVGLATGDDS